MLVTDDVHLETPGLVDQESLAKECQFLLGHLGNTGDESLPAVELESFDSYFLPHLLGLVLQFVVLLAVLFHQSLHIVVELLLRHSLECLYLF